MQYYFKIEKSTFILKKMYDYIVVTKNQLLVFVPQHRGIFPDD